MPLRVDGISRSHSVAVAVGLVIADRGITALSLRTVAAVSRVSPSGLVVQFGNRDRMLEVSAVILGRARIDGVNRRRGEGPRAFLPRDADDVVDTRVWLGLCELGRGHQGVGFQVSAVRQEERRLLAWVLDQARPGGTLDDDDLDLLMAVLDGLNARLCDPHEPMAPERARDLLATCEDRLRGRP